MNLEAARDEIKAAAIACDGTPTAKLVAVLVAAGITDTKEIAAILGVGERAIQKARKPNHSSPPLSSANQDSRTTVRNEPQFANHSSEPNHSSPKTEPQFGRARVEENNLPTNLETSVESKNPPTPRKRGTPAVSKFEILTAFEAYNATAERCALPQAAKLTPDRERKIGARLKDYGLDGWHRALANVERSSFLTGTNDRGWRASLDYLMEPKGFAKTHDGVHGNGRHVAVPVETLVVDAKARDMQRRVEEMARASAEALAMTGAFHV